MTEIAQEKAEEYRQVAGILAAKIELFNEVLKDQSMTLDEVRSHAELLHMDMRSATTSPEERKMLWDAMCVLNSIRGLSPDNG